MTGARCAALALAALLVHSTGARAAEPEKVLLRLKPHAAVTYAVSINERSTREKPGRPSIEPAMRTAETIQQTVTAAAADALTVVVTPGTRVVFVREKTVGQNPPGKPLSYTMTTRGARPDAKDDPSAALFPVLPEQAVAPGYTWSATVPGTPDFPLPIAVEHTFKSVAPVDGLKCAILMSTGHAEGVDPVSQAKVSFEMKSEIAIALDEGVIARSMSWLRTRGELAKPLATGEAVVLTEVSRTVSRIAAGH